MRWVIAACLLFMPNALPAAAQQPSEFEVFVEQGGTVVPFEGVVTLERKPFAFVIHGPNDVGFAVIASAGAGDVEALQTPEDFLQRFHPAHCCLVGEPRQERFLQVNEAGDIAPGENGLAQRGGFAMWEEAPEYNVLSFQTYEIDDDGNVVARREINQIYFGRNQRIPVENYPEREIHLAFTLNPPVRRLSHLNPHHGVLRFSD